MPVQRVFTGQNHLDDLEVARQLGARLWGEGDLQLDFSDIASVTPAFATELCRTIVERRSPAVLSNALLVHTMAPQVQSAFLPAIMAALGSPWSCRAPCRGPAGPGTAGGVAADETSPPETAAGAFPGRHQFWL